MTEDRDDPVVRLPPDQLTALGQALREGAIRTPPYAPSPTADILTGREAAVLQRTISRIIDDELSRRQVLPEREIRAIAKDVAHAVYSQAIRGVEERLRGFFTEEGIEAIVFAILKEVGIKADKEHAEATREIVESIFRNYRRRSEYGADFLREIIKALAVSIVSIAVTYLSIKGVPH